MAKRKIPELYVEFASDPGNCYFLAVCEFRRKNYLIIVDNITDTEMGAYVLDYAQQEGMNLRDFLSLVTLWFYKSSHLYPLSFELSRLGVSARTNKIYKTFELAHVTRLIGNDFRFDLNGQPQVKRRRVNKIPAGVEIKLRKSGQVIHFTPQLQEQPIIEVDF